MKVFLVLYVAMGLMWLGFNFAFSAERLPPRYIDSVREGIRAMRLGATVFASYLFGLAIWPVTFFWTLFPHAFGDRALSFVMTYFRRNFIDGDKWQAVLADPPPQPAPVPDWMTTGCHPPMLGCDGKHAFGQAPCPCFVKCETCGIVHLTEAFIAAEMTKMPP
jgi:hypothetical protein